MKLYNLEKSGNCYKIRLFLSLLGIEYSSVSVNVADGENKTKEYLEMNPNGLMPVLADDETTVYDSAAILVYLAKEHAGTQWLPDDSVQLANVVRWLTFEQSEGRYGLARARAITLKMPSMLAQLGTLEESHVLGNLALDMLNKQLSETRWLAGGPEPTIADIACYPYTAMCHEGGLSMTPHSAINRWLDEIQNLQGYIALPVA